MIAHSAPAMSCTICNGSMSRLFSHDRHWICGCTACGHRAAEVALPREEHVSQVYGDSYFEDGGAGYPGYLREGELLRSQGRRYARVMAAHRAPGTVLDVGAAAGFILKGFEEEGWRGEGVEPNRRMAEFGRRELGLSLHASTLESFSCGERFDLVSMIQVLPSFIDPRRALATAAELTKPGGYWLIESWDRGSFTARLLGRSWHEYSPPSILHWFTRRSLARLADDLGFDEVGHGTPAKWIAATHVKSLLGYRLANSPVQPLVSRLMQLMPDRVVLPYPAEDLFYSVFRKR